MEKRRRVDEAASDSLGPRLIAAVRARDVSATARLLEEGADPDACDVAEATLPPAIVLAAWKGGSLDDGAGPGPDPESLAIVQKLLAAGADPSVCDRAGRSALLASILSADFARHVVLPSKVI